ncbi:MAG: TIGR01212 family radical SAM protein [Prevotella sp.]|nr:TIGR01212 family radical SAM protein [Prevotella sp.]
MQYNDFGTWLRKRFPDFRIQKISIDAGFTCPNRDGRISTGGCTYCDNRTFNPSYCDRRKSIREQLREGKRFFNRKYSDMKYLAYFQAFTNTYESLDSLRRMYEEALAEEDVVGLVIGTRPDCISAPLLDYLEELSRQTFLIVEYGIESANDATLRRINRGHTFECSRKAVEMTAERGILTGGHIILGLPGEDREESLRQAPIISSLPLNILKIHQMQIIKGTHLAEEYLQHPFPLYTVEEYLHLIADYISLLRKDLVLERFVSQSPPELLIAPRWGLKNYQFVHLLEAMD